MGAATPILLAALLLAGGLAGAAEGVLPLERTLSLNLWGVGLNDAAREIQSQTGVELLFYRHDLPANQNTDDLYLVSGRVTLRAVMECLARRYAFRYRVSRSGKLELSRGYGWVEGGPELSFQRLDDITPAAGGDTKEVGRLLGEFVKVLPLLSGDYSMAIERNPTRDSPNSLQCVSALPPVLAYYLGKAVLCLGGQPGDHPVATSPNAGQLFASADETTADWQDTLSRQVSLAADGDLRQLLAAVAAKAGVAIVLASPPGRAAAAHETGNIGLGRATESLAKAFGYGRRVFLANGGVCFENGPGETWEMDNRSREIFWDGLAVAGFDAKSAAERAGGGVTLVANLRQSVFPRLWADPLCGAAYSEVTGRLALVAPKNVIAAVAARLGAPVE